MTHYPPAPEGTAAAKYVRVLVELALAYPESVEEHPWGHYAIKVRGKAFVFLATSPDGLKMSAKLPDSHLEAKLLPFAEATGYGLGKSGWVTASFAVDEVPPVALLESWLEESYRAIAPKKLVAVLDGEAPAGTRRKKA